MLLSSIDQQSASWVTIVSISAKTRGSLQSRQYIDTLLNIIGCQYSMRFQEGVRDVNLHVHKHENKF